MENTMPQKEVIPSNLLAAVGVGAPEICYAMVVTSSTKRKPDPASGKRPGFFSGLGSAINDTLSSKGLYFVRTHDGRIFVLSEKAQPICFYLSQLVTKAETTSGRIVCTFTLPGSDYENICFNYDNASNGKTFVGNLIALLADCHVDAPNVTDYYAEVVVLRPAEGKEPYKFTRHSKMESLIAFDENGLYIINDWKRHEFSQVLAYYQTNNYIEIVTLENGLPVVTEVYLDKNSASADPELNLVRAPIGEAVHSLPLAVNSDSIRAQQFISVISCNGLVLVATEDTLYSVKGTKLFECGVFCFDDDLYVKDVTGETFKYEQLASVGDTLMLLPSGYDKIFMNTQMSHPFLVNGILDVFYVNQTCIKNDNVVFEYSNMKDCRYNSNNFSCKIYFEYDGVHTEIVTAASLGIFICNMQEKCFMSVVTRDYTINQLYDCFYKRYSMNFLAGTFAEIYKTEKLVNVDIPLEEIIAVVKSDESPVMRNAFQSILGKFSNVKDTQADLIQKVTLIEIQRKKIQKLFDEWTLYYPHYIANVQVAWLKYVFGNAVTKEMLNNEYWKCVAHYKRMLSGGNSFVQKYMGEIASCTGRISSALPDDARRADITGELRIGSNTAVSTLDGGVNVMMGVAAGVEISNIFIRGFAATNPLGLSMSAKMLVDSYIKDSDMRKNIKSFGLQSLEWWEIFMRGVRVHVLELSNGVSEYNRLCLKRDTEIFKKLSPDVQAKTKARLSEALKEKISSSVDDKFSEVLPQLNLRINNVIDEIENNTSFMNVTLEDFKKNLYI